MRTITCTTIKPRILNGLPLCGRGCLERDDKQTKCGITNTPGSIFGLCEPLIRDMLIDKDLEDGEHKIDIAVFGEISDDEPQVMSGSVSLFC